MKTSSKRGSMLTAAHECLVMLLNEWHGMGNQVLPRDDLVTVAAETVAAANDSESRDSRKFESLWFSDNVEFEPIRAQYAKMLDLFPSDVANQWKGDVGISKDPKSETQDEKVDTSPINDNHDLPSAEMKTDEGTS